MRSFTFLTGLLATVPTAFAHYNFEALIVNNNITSAYEFVRQTNNSNSPITNVNSTDMVCNSGGLLAATKAKTSTYSVSPGDEVGFTVNSNIGHPGPLSVWLSKAPDGTTAQDYDGDGDWFKVYELTTSSISATDGLQWATYVDGGIKNFTFALPDSLPAGEYLMRAEHIALHGAGSYGGAQFYIGCAQLTVGGSGTGTPSPTTTIPGDYTGYESGILINIYYPVPTSYTAPGPVTWPNSCEDHTANFVDQTSDGDCTGSDSSSDSSASASASASAVATASSSSSVVASASATPVTSSSSSAATSVAPAESNVAAATTSTASASATKTSVSASASATKSAGSGTCKKKRGLKAKKAKKAAMV